MSQPPTGGPAPPEPGRDPESESIDREMRVLERHRADTRVRTSNAVRRTALAIATMVLIALLLWWAFYA
jgi:hypothetical protein